ncbi:MAG: SMP-30/gluconolactonase/LRE family protein [Planctomycetota bacterium]
MQEIAATPLNIPPATLGEGPIWDPRESVYWWIDIVGKKLFQYSPKTNTNREWQLDQMVGTVVPREQGGLMLALQHGFATFDPETGHYAIVHDPEPELPDNRFNDGKCDPAGRFWAGTMRIEDHMNIFTGSLYSLEVDGHVIKRLDDIGVSNGIVWSSDAKTMYFIDSPRFAISAFDYDRSTGAISNRRVVFTAKDIGAPDGMAIDENGKLWVAFWGGWCVAQICPDSGEILSKVTVPVEQCSACAFGGDNLNQLFITTAAEGLSDQQKAHQPLAGNVFVAEVPVRGVLQPAYGG